MKVLLNILGLVSVITFCFSDDTKPNYNMVPSTDKLEKLLEISDPLEKTYTYSKVGTSIGYQHVGYGYRIIDVAENTGYDYSINANILPILLREFELCLITTLEYNKLKYTKGTNSTNYFGFGCEVGVGKTFLTAERRSNYSSRTFPVVNPKLIWGSEEKHAKFSQVSVNLIPAAILTYGASMALFGPNKRGQYFSGKEIGQILALASSSVVFDYTIGF